MPEPMLLLAATDTPELASRLERWIDQPDRVTAGDAPAAADGPARLAIVDVTQRRLELARKVLAQDLPWRGRDGLWFEPRGLLVDGGQVAFLFPGVEPRFEPRLDDVVGAFGLHDLAATRNHHAGTPMPDLERQARAIFAVNRILHRALEQLGVVPDMVAGHSIGEWSGALAAGVVTEQAIDGLLAQLRPGTTEVADPTYLALTCGAGQATELLDGLERTVVSHDNCPHQSMVCGPADEVAVVAERCRARRVLAQELPFRSGFHTPLFAGHSDSFEAVFRALPRQPARVPLWSATTCRPYPSDPERILELAVRHLLEPVRFRQLVRAMHAAGARVFLQAGVGSLTGFVDDTLHDLDAVAIPVNTHQRSGLAQLRRVAAALWVEGAQPVLAPVFGALTPKTGARSPGRVPRSRVWRQTFSLAVEPAWADHALFRQPDRWPYPEDRFPLVPMAGIAEILGQCAGQLRPDLVPVAIEQLAAFRYLVVDPPTEATMRATEAGRGSDGTVLVKVAVDGHARATVRLAPTYPAAPPAESVAPLTNPRPSPVDAECLYRDRYMFHGPAYQGIVELADLADDGARGIIRTPAAPGGLLDNAGQVMGLWLLAHTDVDRLVLPTLIERIELFGPHPPADALVDCTVTGCRLDDQTLRADLALVADDRVWSRISGWVDRRYATEPDVFEALRWPERNGMSVESTGCTVVHERWPDSATRELIARRYLGVPEHRDFERLHPLAQRQFLLGRIAVKDAVRRWLWRHGHGPLFPAEVVVANAHGGRPVARGPYAQDLRVSLAHADHVGVAVVADGVDVGIDVESVDDRPGDFAELVLTDRERRLDPPDGVDRATWLTVMWTAKEAAAKAAGRGLQGRPKDFEIAERDDTRLRVGDRWVAFEPVDAPATSRDIPRKEQIVAWTLCDR